MSTLVLFSTYHSYIGLVLPYITPKYRQCIVAKDSVRREQAGATRARDDSRKICLVFRVSLLNRPSFLCAIVK